MNAHSLRPLVEGGRYYEGPRWSNGELWFADTLAGSVLSVGEAGETRKHCSVEGVPCGLGFLPSGDLIVLSMFRMQLLKWSNGRLSPYADLSHLAKGTIDDMIIDRQGRAFVGDLGGDLLSGAINGPIGRILLVTPDGGTRVVADGLQFPNGIAVNHDGTRLIVAESNGDCLVDFDIKSDGSLALRRRFGSFGEPDGICLDRDGCVWVALFKEDCFARVDETGRVVERIPAYGRAIACATGGADRQTLFCLSAETSHEELMKGRSKARIDTVRIAVPGDGAP